VFRRRPDLLVALSVPVLLVAGMLPWQRDVLCTEAGCGTVAASAWSGSPVWASVLLAGLAAAGAWVLVLPTRARVSIGVAAITGVVGVLAAAVLVVSLEALVVNRVGFFHFDLPVTETFPVLAVHPGAGLVLGLVGLLLQAAGGWGSLRQRNALVSPLRRPVPVLVSRTYPSPGHPVPPTHPSPGPAAFSVRGGSPGHAVPPVWGGSPGHAAPPVWGGSAAQAPPSAAPERPAAAPPPGPGPAAGQGVPAGWEAVAFGQGPPTPRRHRRR
jgi:hypothetical protein